MAGSPRVSHLLVESLPSGCDDAHLREILGNPRGLKSVSIRDQHAILDFYSFKAAQDVLTKFNYRKIDGRPLHISVYHPDNPPDPRATLYLSGLPPELSDEELHRMFKSKVFLVVIERNSEGVSLGTATVRFENAQAAEAALQRDAIEIGTRRIPLKRQKDAPSLPLPRNIIVVEASDETQVLREFSSVGSIHSIEPVSSQFVVFFRESVVDKLAGYAGVLRYQPRVPADFGPNLLGELERRAAFVSSIPADGDPEGQKLRDHLATAGDLVFLDVVRTDGKLPYAYVQYATAEVRQAAVEKLDGTVVSPGTLPIRVLPYFDNRLGHPAAGLLQLNELSPAASGASLKAQFAGFGSVIATTISPTWSGHRVGFVLFERFESAQRASVGLRNVLLHPPGDPIKLIGGFIESEKATVVCLAVYNLPETLTYAQFERQCQESVPVRSAAVLSCNGTRSGFAYFSNSRAFAKTYSKFAESGALVEALHGNGLVYAMKLLRTSELPHAWTGCIVFLKHLPPVPNSELFDALATRGSVAAAFQVITPDTGNWAASGVALFTSDAVRIVNEAARHEVMVAGHPIVVLPFQGAFGAMPPVPPRPRLPDRAGSARDWLRKLAQLNLSPQDLDTANAKIGTLTIEQTYTMVRYQPEQILVWLSEKA